ncbi:MAG: FmdB family zinc ribbon protein [Streptosporangiaceae bacterium]
MPTYQYTCTECGEPVEAVQKFSDPPLTVCENCGGRLRKVFSPVGIVFKGSGFYRTDSRKNATPTVAADKDKPAGDSKSDKSDSSSTVSSTSEKSEKKSDSSASSNGSSSTAAKSSSEKVA